MSAEVLIVKKRPVIVQAMLWDGKEETAKVIAQWMGSPKGLPARLPDSKGGYTGWAIEIQTLEGMMLADVGDYIIRGIKGEFYPCKPDIFNATYEKASTI